MKTNRKLYLFIAMSLDGYIAKQDDDISFLEQVEKQGEDYGYSKFIATVDTIVLGRKTYDKILSMNTEPPYGNREIYVITRTPRPDEGNVHYYSGRISILISSLRSKEGLHIYCDGGAETVHHLLIADLVDEMIISVIPVLLGDGIALFKGGLEEKKLTLQSATSYEKGLVQMHYIRQRES
ncbi:MAG TPA: dihydrofolate reductase family protein [Prolixibacteraceae bacterium]|nr:dihydrofolate reductase family protein [Prolixibacteraceae bacterium]